MTQSFEAFRHSVPYTTKAGIQIGIRYQPPRCDGYAMSVQKAKTKFVDKIINTFLFFGAISALFFAVFK